MSPAKRSSYAVLRKGGRLTPWEYTVEHAAPTEIDIRVTHNGLCHSDVAMRNDDWCAASPLSACSGTRLITAAGEPAAASCLGDEDTCNTTVARAVSLVAQGRQRVSIRPWT